MITTTLSTKNQITFPKYILELLGIQSGDKLLVQTETDQIIVKPAGKSIVDSLIKSIQIPKNKQNIPFKKVLASTKKIVAKKLSAK